MTIKALREKRAKLVADARAILDDPNSGAEGEAKFDTLMAEADALKAKIDRLERLDDSEKHLSERRDHRAAMLGVSAEEVEAQEMLENGAFSSFLRRGMNGLSEAERPIAAARIGEIQNAQGEGTNTAGGYTVPTGFYDQLIDAQAAFGGMLDVGYTFNTTSGNPLPIPTDNDTTNEGAILGENTQVTTQDVTFGAVNMNAYTYTSKLILVSNQLLQDSAFDLNAFLAGKMGDRIARIVNRHFTTGTGSNQPTGIMAAATLGVTGASGETAMIAFDDLIDLEHSVDPAYRLNARFMMADSSLKIIKKLKDSQGRPLWLPGYAVKEPDTINGYAYTINQAVDQMAANAKSVAFGDLSKYFIRRVAGAQVLRLTERYADYNQTGFLAFQRWDGTLVDAGTHPVKYFKNAAS